MNKKYVPMILGVVCIFTLALSFFWLYGSRVFISRASGTCPFSPQDSYLFGTPGAAAADGIEQITISGFFICDKGLPSVGLKADLVGAEGLILQGGSAISDTSGKVQFRLSSVRRGIFPIQLEVNDTILPQIVNVTFN